jgi:hypothetical protein
MSKQENNKATRLDKIIHKIEVLDKTINPSTQNPIVIVLGFFI